MSNAGSNYPQMTTGIGVITPAMWNRIMRSLEHYENEEESRSEELSPESLNSRITDLEMHKPFFFAKLLRAKVLDLELFNPNVYEYAWVEVRPVSRPTDCCEGCLTSRNGCSGNPNDGCLPIDSILSCCTGPLSGDCLTYLNYQGLWNWWEHTENTSWGDTLANSDTGYPYRFNTWDLKSDYNPHQYPCLATNLAAPNCNPFATGDVGQPNYPNINTIAYTKPAMNLMEAFNNHDQAGGVDQTTGIGDFMMQVIGGGDTSTSEVFGYPGSYSVGIPECHDNSPPLPVPLDHPPCTQYEFPLKSTPIVLMHNIRESDGTFRQVFQEANSYDGTCVDC